MAAEGYLVTRSYTSDGEIPLSGTTVTVSKRSGGQKRTLLGVLLSDESGLTAPLTIETPDLEASLQPSDTGSLPFTEVEIVAEHPSFDRIVVEDAQVFAGQTSQQALQFIPLDELPAYWNLTEFFEIPPQNL